MTSADLGLIECWVERYEFAAGIDCSYEIKYLREGDVSTTQLQGWTDDLTQQPQMNTMDIFCVSQLHLRVLIGISDQTQFMARMSATSSPRHHGASRWRLNDHPSYRYLIGYSPQYSPTDHQFVSFCECLYYQSNIGSQRWQSLDPTFINDNRLSSKHDETVLHL